MQVYTDPASGRQYTVDAATGQSRWLDEPQPPTAQPAQPFAPPPSTQPYPQPHATLPQPAQQYGQPPPGQPPTQLYGAAGWPQQPAPKKRTGLKVLGAVVGVFVVLGIIGAITSGGDQPATTAAPSSATSDRVNASKSDQAAAKASAPASPKIGTPVRDGKFEFTVTGTKTTQRVGNEYLHKDAQGKFLLVSVTVKNIGKEAQLFDSSSQKLLDASGVEYSADGAAGIYLGDQARSFLEQINPGNSVKGIVVFDVPDTAKITQIELHDSPFSGGVKVQLTK